MVSEINRVGNLVEWIIDRGGTRHICTNKDLYKELKDVDDKKVVYVGNSNRFPVLAICKVHLKLTSGKVALDNVLYVLDMCRNFISGALYNKASFKLIFETDKLVMSKNGQFVGKGFCNVRLFVLDVEMSASTSFVYIFDSIDICLYKLGHVNTKSINRMKIMNSLANLISYDMDKCQVCREAKHSKKPFNEVTQRQIELLELIHTDLADYKSYESIGDLRRSKIPSVDKSFGPDFIVEEDGRYLDVEFVGMHIAEEDPKSYDEAMRSVDAALWKEAIDSEIESIMSNYTWEIVNFPRECKPIGYKWVFRKKLKADGTIDKFKARLVGKVFTQKSGLNYFDTYSSITKTASIRVMFVIASMYNLFVHQMDMKTAFLNGDLDEEIYMDQPDGF
ncbi:uncharacterized protein LOC141620517 [Silene latifolia]|uniref:uncharacterized protein LOC141620517 n=1 Tax=Silene latifolia TaxID=37657 RepID=UPI003D783994